MDGVGLQCSAHFECCWCNLWRGWGLWKKIRTWHMRGKMTAEAREGPEDGGCVWGVGGRHFGRGERIRSDNEEGVKVRTVCWNCQGQWLDIVQTMCSSITWEMKLESSLDTSEIYYRLVGRGHQGNSSLYIENIQVCLSKDWHWWETSSQENLQWSPEIYVF